MVVKKRFFLALLTGGLTLAGCETPSPQAHLNIKPPLSSLKAQKEVSPPVAHAMQLLKDKKYKEASQFINQVLQSEPKSIVFHVLNGLTYEILAQGGDAGGTELATIGYQNAINLDPSNVFAITQLAKLKYREKLYNEAQELYASALLKKPNDPDLWHELAAASYYAYDAKTALSAINKAEKLKPSDPLIHRSAAMIYAALGNFSTAKKHIDFFKEKVGADPAVEFVTARFDDWQSLYKSGRIRLAAAADTSKQSPASSAKQPAASAPSTAPSSDGGGEPSSDGDEGASSKSPSDIGKELVAQEVLEKPLPDGNGADTSAGKGPQIIVDCYLLRITEDAQTSKGNNILENLAVTLTPGGFTKFQGKLGGTGVRAIGETGSNIVSQPSSGFNANQEPNGTGINSAFTAGQDTMNLLTKGAITGKVFAAGLTWAGLTYSLNIANAIDARTEVVSRPSLMTFLNKPSIFFSGNNLVTGFTGQFGGSINSYPVGVTLEITPKALEGDLVTLDIGIEGSLLTQPDPDLKETILVATTRVDTHANVRLGETLMLGGIYERIELASKNGFPGLQDVPLVQYFFSNETTFSTRRSIVFMLTPRSPEAVKTQIKRAMTREAVEPHLYELSSRNPDWFNTHPNMAEIFHYLAQDPIIYYEFRSGDILPPSWGWETSLSEKLQQLSAFLFY